MKSKRKGFTIIQNHLHQCKGHLQIENFYKRILRHFSFKKLHTLDPPPNKKIKNKQTNKPMRSIIRDIYCHFTGVLIDL